MRDFPLTDEMKALLARPEVADWLLGSVRHGASPGFDSEGRLCFRFADDGEAERFRERWLSPPL